MKLMKLSLLIILLFTFSVSAQNLKTAIASIGCTKIKVSDIKPMSLNDEEYKQWLKDQKIKSKTSFLAKCGNYRYLFEEEIFANEEDASGRYVRQLPPKEDGKSDFAVPILLREGFRVKNRVYTVGAFAAFLADEGYVSKLKNKLKTKIR